MTDNKYQHGKIYKIISNQTEDVYYGSTVEDKITNRLAGYRKEYKGWLAGKKRFVTSFEIVKHDDAKIILLEYFSCNTKYELTAREQWYIDNNECVNKQNATTGLEINEYNKQYQKQYRKQYGETNKNGIAEYKKLYNKDNKNALSEKKKQYYQDHKNEILQRDKQKIVCECGKSYLYGSKLKHTKTNFHQNFIKS